MRKTLLLIAIALLSPFEAVAQDLMPRLREAPTSVGDVRRVSIEGGPAWLFELRGARDYAPYLLIDIPEDYRREGFVVSFDFNYGNMTWQAGPPMNPFVWNTIEVEVNWSNGADGYARVSHNGRQIASYSGFTGPDAAPGLANFGLYRSNLDAVEARGGQIEDLQLLVRNYQMTKLN